MNDGVRRMALGLVLVGAALAVPFPADRVAAQNCDPSYPTFCLPYLGYNAYDCDDIPYRNFPVIGEDINYFDWDTDPQTGEHYKDGIGCESYFP